MKNMLIGAVLLMVAHVAKAEPVVYTNEASYLADLATLGHTVIHESFEDDAVWESSRNSIPKPGSTPSVTSQGLVWTSNYAQNNIATGTVGGSAPDGMFAIYSLPHGMTTDSGLYCDDAEDPIPIECYQNDGLRVQSATGEMLYAFGGRIDTANNGKVTFLLNGIDINGNDTDNIDNWQREGDWADQWAFVGVIDPNGFSSVELRELRGKDFQQVFLFADDFGIGRSNVQLACDFNGTSSCDVDDLDLMFAEGPIANGVSVTLGINDHFDINGDTLIDLLDRDAWLAHAAAEDNLGTPYKLADANLDGIVDGQDFLDWNAAKFTSSLLWSDGNFNGDTVVDGQDFLAWNANKFTSSDGVSTVPEPGMAMMAFVVILVCGKVIRH
jgi:hypothetical protein